MNENIATIQEFLTRGELRLNRVGIIYQILSIDEKGQAETYKEPHWGYHSIPLTEKEIASLARLCFPKPTEADKHFWAGDASYFEK